MTCRLWNIPTSQYKYGPTMSNLPSRLPHHKCYVPLNELGRWKSEAWPIPEEFQAHKYHVQTHGTGMTGLLDAFFFPEICRWFVYRVWLWVEVPDKTLENTQVAVSGMLQQGMCWVVLFGWFLFIHLFDKGMILFGHSCVDVFVRCFFSRTFLIHTSETNGTCALGEYPYIFHPSDWASHGFLPASIRTFVHWDL